MSFSYDKLKGKIKERFGTQDAFAKAIGMSRATLSIKLNNSSEFSQNEILKAIELLGLSKVNVDEYFFTQKVKKTEQ